MRPSSAISILDVIEAVEGDAQRRKCVLRGGPCKVSGVCGVHALFVDAQDALLATLRSATFESLTG